MKKLAHHHLTSLMFFVLLSFLLNAKKIPKNHQQERISIISSTSYSCYRNSSPISRNRIKPVWMFLSTIEYFSTSLVLTARNLAKISWRTLINLHVKQSFMVHHLKWNEIQYRCSMADETPSKSVAIKYHLLLMLQNLKLDTYKK